jgi:hypothetical protein
VLWWDWSAKRKWSLLAGILVIAALPWIALGWLPDQPGAFAGGTTFLAIPQMVGWMLFVGLTTGYVPMHYGRKVSRKTSPIEFWSACAVYAALVTLFLSFILYVIFDAS